MAGHVHVVAGDITRLTVDAWLLPTDQVFRVSKAFATAIDAVPDTCLSGHAWGGRRVVRLSDSRFPRVWLADVGRAGEEPAWYADVIVPFVEDAVEALGAVVSGRPLLIGVNVLGTGQGGMEGDKGAVHEALLPALYAAAARYDVDLALVCWQRRSYSAAQRVRRRLLDSDHGSRVGDLWDLGQRGERLSLVARELASHVRHQNLVLFIGAGVSAGAGLPAWQGLLDAIAESLGEDAPPTHRLHCLDVRDQALVLERRLKAQDRTLHEAVRDHIYRTDYALAHAQLASLSVREAVTTNYDQLFEAAVRPVDGDLAVLPYQAVRPGQRWLLKLHGSIDRDDSVVLTRSDYLTAPARHSALFGLVQAMLLTRHMLFVGYSLADEDFHQVVHEVRLARAKEPGETFGTVLALFDDPLFAELWRDDLDVVALAEQPAGDPTDEQVATAARTLQILLDLVAFEAADLDAFLLDPTYESLLSREELGLAALLRPLVESELLDDVANAVPAAARVARLLRELGNVRKPKPSS